VPVLTHLGRSGSSSLGTRRMRRARSSRGAGPLASGAVQYAAVLGVEVVGSLASVAEQHVVVARPAVDEEPVPFLAGVVSGREVGRRTGRQRLVVSADVGPGATVELGAAIAIVDEPFGVAALVLDHSETGRVQQGVPDAVASCFRDDEQRSD